MKFNKLSQFSLVSALSLSIAACLTGCALHTVDYVFVVGSQSTGASNPGQIATYAVDAQSGAIRSVQKMVNTGGNSPIAAVVTADYLDMYVANASNNSVVHFAIASNGGVKQADAVTIPGTPTAMAVDPAGKYLYVTYGSTSATLAAYSLSSSRAIGSATATVALTLPSYPTDTIISTGITVLPNGSAVYATVYDQSAYNPGVPVTSTANPGWIYGFKIGSSNTLTAVTGSPWQAGVKPSAVTVNPTGELVYATDYASSQIIGYLVQSTSVLNFAQNGPFRTGNQPSAIQIDPRGKYLYVANALDSTLGAYTIDRATGTLTTTVNVSGTASNTTDTQPVALAVDPALSRFVYTANHLGNSVSGFRLNPDTGALSLTQSTPYPSIAQPVAILCVPHGNHAIQAVFP